MNRIILLDSGPLGLITNPSASPENPSHLLNRVSSASVAPAQVLSDSFVHLTEPGATPRRDCQF
jgi:hypothetical protein